MWPPMAGLLCAGGGLLADSGGSGCATAWHRHLLQRLQPKAGAIPCSCRAGLAAVVEERPRPRLSTARVQQKTVCYKPNLLSARLDSRCGNRAMRAVGCRVRALHGSHGSRRHVGEFWLWPWLLLLSSAWEPRTGLWRGEGICSVFRMNPVHADHLRAHGASYAAGGFAEAKGKYRGSIVEGLAVLSIGWAIVQDLDDKVRIAGVDGSLRRARRMSMYAHVRLYSTICTYGHSGPPTGHGSRSASPQAFGGTTACSGVQ